MTFEGPEGSGKSTQARLLYEQLHAMRYPVILVREPGGTRIGDLIRRIVLDLQHTEMAPTTETVLFSAAHAQLVSAGIRPELDQGGVVLCDRYADSTYAYQGYGLGRDIDELRAITAAATGGLRPDVTIYLDLSAEEGLERKQRKQHEMRQRSSSLSQILDSRQPVVEWNRLDARELAYHQRVEAGYRDLIAQDTERWQVFDARQPIDTLAEQILHAITAKLRRITTLESLTDSR
ncbi:MAG TPA: dTMP kinase [Roseiflexaceae bacterium]|nr:dTMP kinase [Roseiflexaceae bacterium]